MWCKTMSSRRIIHGLVALLFLFVLAGCGSSKGSSPAESSAKKTKKTISFDGKTINFLVGYSPGGGYDLYARMLAPALQKYLPGSTVIVRNIPGAGSLKATNELYQAKPDGLTIGLIDGMGMTTSQLAEEKGRQFDLTKFTWLGRVVTDPFVMVVNTKVPYKNIQELMSATQPIKLAGMGVGSSPYVAEAFIAKALKLNCKMVMGANGSSEAIMGVIQGTSDAVSTSYETLRTYIKNKQLVPVVQLAKERESEIADIPLASEVVTDEQGKVMIKAIVDILEVGRSVAGPPGMPADVTETLRDALKKALEDPEFVATAQKTGRMLKPLSGPDTEAQVKKALQQPDNVVALIKELMH